MPKLFSFSLSCKALLVALGTLCIYLPCFSQNITALETRLKRVDNTKQDSIEVLNILSRQLAFVDPIKSLEYANISLKLAVESEDPKGEANAYRILAAVYSFNDSYFISMDYLQRSLDIFEELGDVEGIANCYISLGHTYRRLKQREQEIKYHKLSYDIFSELKIPERIGVSAHNLGESYLNINDLGKSRELTNYAIKINDSISNKSVLSSCYKVLGLIEYREKNYLEAEKHFNRVLEISDELGENSQKIAAAESLIGLSRLYASMGNTAKQQEMLQRATIFSKKYNLAEFLRISYKDLITLSNQIQDAQATKEYLKSYDAVTDSINLKQLKDRYDLTQTVVRVHELGKDKKKLEQQNAVQARQLNNWNIIIILIVFFVAMLLYFLLSFSRYNKRLRAQRKLIWHQNSDLEKLNETKDRFFSLVAHDLKSPLISLQSFASLLIDHFDHLEKDQIQAMSKELQEAVSNTLKLTENLITWAQLQMNDLAYQAVRVDINSIMENTIMVYEEVASQKGITLSSEIEKELFTLADQNQIEFVVRNLINNAIKFTNSGGSVSCRASSISEDKLQIVISDTGNGMSDLVKEKLFKLGQTKSTDGTAGEKGTGLGLMLCFEFIKANNATFDLQSQIGEGTTFTITLQKV